MDITKEAYDAAIDVLRKCSSPRGFYAAYPGYKGVWARDSSIMSLGASYLGDEFKKTIARSMNTLATHQPKDGQIANAVMFDVSPPRADFKSIDSSLWFIIAHYHFTKRFKDDSLLRKHKKHIKKAFTWLSYQDTGEDGLLEQQPTSDWQDAFPHRYGYTINTQALYYKVLQLLDEKKEARKIKKAVNDNDDLQLWNGNFYRPWRWKNHNRYHEWGEWFDSLGNLLAIIYGLADEKRADNILRYIKKNNIDQPYPVRVIDPPIRKGSKDWRDYFNDSEAKTPYHYSNGGVWKFIGGFYILALLKRGKVREAEKQLVKLAEGNMQKPHFSEWLHGKTGKPGVSGDPENDGNQGWDAAMYILAYESVKRKRCLL